MQLPKIDFATPVPDSSRAPLIVDEARRRGLETVNRGLEALGQELVRSEMHSAEANLAVALDSINEEIDANKTVNTEYIRKKLGSLDVLPEGLRSKVTEQALDINTGQMVENDREDIPMWMVAGAIYDAESKKALAEASKGITGGWAAEFQEKVTATLPDGAVVVDPARRAQINQKVIKDSVAFFAEQDTKSAIALANSGNFTKAREVVAKSRSMDPDYKEKLSGHIDKIEQLTPVYDALLREDVAGMVTLLGKLQNSDEFNKLEPQERTAVADRLKSEIRQFQEGMKKAADDGMKRMAEAGWNGIFDKQRQGLPVSYRDIPAPGTIHADEQKQMIAYVDALREGKPIKTDFGIYQDLLDKVKAGEDVNLMRYRMSLSDGDLKYLIDVKGGRSGPTFDDFINTDEAINAKLPKGYSPADIKGNADKSAAVGQVKSIIQHELAGLGHRASLGERDEIIDRVVKDNIKITPGWFSDSVKVPTVGIPPAYVVSFRKVAAGLGFGLSDEGLKTTYQDFTYYEPGITKAWGPQAGSKRRLTPDLAIGVYGYLKANWSAIDAELTRAGKPLDNDHRTALAVQGFLSQR